MATADGGVLACRADANSFRRPRRRRASRSTSSGLGQNSVDFVAVVAAVPGVEHQAAAPTVRPAAGRPDRDGDGRLRAPRLADPLYRQPSATTSRAALAREPDARRRRHQRGADGGRRHESVRGDSRRRAFRRAHGALGSRSGVAPGSGRRPRGGAASGRLLLVDCDDIPAATAAAIAAREAGIPTIIDVEDVQPGTDTLLRTSTRSSRPRNSRRADRPRGSRTGARGHRARVRAPLVCVTLGAEGSLA